MTAILVMLTLWLNAGVQACQALPYVPYDVTVTPYAEGTAYTIPGRVLFHGEDGTWRFFAFVPELGTYRPVQVAFSPDAIAAQVESGERTYPLPPPPPCEASFGAWEAGSLFPHE